MQKTVVGQLGKNYHWKTEAVSTTPVYLTTTMPFFPLKKFPITWLTLLETQTHISVFVLLPFLRESCMYHHQNLVCSMYFQGYFKFVGIEIKQV